MRFIALSHGHGDINRGVGFQSALKEYLSEENDPDDEAAAGIIRLNIAPDYLPGSTCVDSLPFSRGMPLRVTVPCQ